jgi:hypothetical protein
LEKIRSKYQVKVPSYKLLERKKPFQVDNWNTCTWYLENSACNLKLVTCNWKKRIETHFTSKNSKFQVTIPSSKFRVELKHGPAEAYSKMEQAVWISVNFLIFQNNFRYTCNSNYYHQEK